MSSFEKQSTATAFRDVVREMVQAEVDRIRPRYRYATVVQVTDVNKCEIQYPGEDNTVVVTMPYNARLEPGQVVRIEGMQGDRFIANVIGGGGGGGGGTGNNVRFHYESMYIY